MMLGRVGTRGKSLAPLVQRAFAVSCTNNGDVKNVTVLGGGVMGSGIAQLSAQNGFNVVVIDNDEYAQKCMVSICKSLTIIAKKKFPNEAKIANEWYNDVLSNIKTTQSYSSGCEKADLIIETIVECPKAKKSLYEKVVSKMSKDAILATNTSSLSIDDLSENLECSDRFVGLHFFNPVWYMKLVEVIGGRNTSDVTIRKSMDFVDDIGKTAVRCDDTPGFIVNHLLYPYMMEGLRLMERGHGTVHDIDTAMKLGAGLPMGPFEMMDVIGIDTVQQVMRTWHEKHPEDSRYLPSETINKLVSERKFGMKTKQGFYPYRHTLY